jgi:hypothetical protein
VAIENVAVVGQSGAAVVSTVYEDPENPRTAGTAITGDHLLISSVRTSTVEFVSDGSVIMPSGMPVAYGLTVLPECSIVLGHVTAHDGGYGFFAAGGTLELRDAVVTGQVDAAGARAAGVGVLLEHFEAYGNARDEVIEREGLPEAASLPLPTAIEF